MHCSSYKLFQIQTTKRGILAAAFLGILCHDSRYKYDRKPGHNGAASFRTSLHVSSVLPDLLCENRRMQKCCTVLSLFIVWIEAWWLSVGSLSISTFCTNLSNTAEVINRVKNQHFFIRQRLMFVTDTSTIHRWKHWWSYLCYLWQPGPLIVFASVFVYVKSPSLECDSGEEDILGNLYPYSSLKQSSILQSSSGEERDSFDTSPDLNRTLSDSTHESTKVNLHLMWWMKYPASQCFPPCLWNFPPGSSTILFNAVD